MAALPVQQVVDALHAAGLSLVLTPDLTLKVSPASILTPELRDLIRTTKDMLIGWLRHEVVNDPPPAPAHDGEDERAAFRDQYARAMRAESTATDPPAIPDPKVPPRAEATPANPDRWCWPNSTPLSTEEIDTFTARLALFTDKGEDLQDAERLADKLVVRDREGDDRRACLECAHLHGAGRWRCGNAHRAGIGTDRPPADLVKLLQRCDGFNLKGNRT